MTIHIATTTPIGRNSKKLIVAALLGAVLATNVATAGVTWRLARHDGEVAERVRTQAAATDASPVAAQEASIAAEMPSIRDGDPYPREVLTVYLVGTEEQETFVQSRIYDANQLRHRTGQPSVSDVVFLVRTAEDDARTAEWIALIRAQQESLRLPGVFVVDVR